MTGIYLAALLTTALAAAGGGLLVSRLPHPARGRLLWLAALLVLPLQPLAFYFVRLPIDHWLAGHLGSASAIHAWLTSLYAPLTEEPAKLVPLLIPAVFRDIRPANFARYALAIGIGFAIGEMWFIAERVARQPALASAPFYSFSGYAGERLMTCVIHSACVALALNRLRRRFVLGFATAAAAHWAVNFPLLLMSWNVGGIGRGAWMILVQCWLMAVLIAAVLLLACFVTGRAPSMRWAYGVRRCPECGGDYDAPIFALNFGPTRYERCPHCKRWHWTHTLPKPV